MSDIEDRIWIKAFCLTRTEFVFRQLYRKHTVYLYRLSLQLLNRDITAADDVIQETWMRAIEKLPGFRGDSSFKTWLSGILINCCREHLRKKEIWNTDPIQDTILWNAENKTGSRIDMEKALALLPPGYREILLLHDFEGFKHNEIGQLLGISEGTSKSQLFHARNAIKRLLN